MASLIIRSSTAIQSTIARRMLVQKEPSSLLRYKSTRLPPREEVRSLKHLMDTLNTALTAPQMIHHNRLQKGLVVGVENCHLSMPIAAKKNAPHTMMIAQSQPSLISVAVAKALPVPLIYETDNDEQVEENSPRLMQEETSVSSSTIQEDLEDKEKVPLPEDHNQNQLVEPSPVQIQDDAKLCRKLLHECIGQGDVEGLVLQIRSSMRHFKAGTVNPTLLRKVFWFLIHTNNPFYAQELLLMIRSEKLGFDGKFHVKALRQLCTLYGGKEFSTSHRRSFHKVEKRIKTLINEILSVPSEGAVRSVVGHDLLPFLVRSPLMSIHQYARPLYHHYMNNSQRGLSATQLEELLHTFRYSPTTKQPSSKQAGGSTRYQPHTQNSLNLSFYAAILQDYVKAVLELTPEDDPVDPRRALTLISKTYPFVDHTHLIYGMLQMLRPLFSNDLRLDRGTLEHLMAAAAKRNHQALGALIWDLYDLWNYTPSENCFEGMIILLLKQDLIKKDGPPSYYETDHDFEAVDCLTQMIEAGYTPQRAFIKSMGNKLRHSENRSKAWVRLIKSNRCYQTTEAFNVMLAAQAAQGHLGIGLKLLDDLNKFHGIKPNKESYGFVMEALATKVQMIINRAEREEKRRLENTAEQNEPNDGANNTADDHNAVSFVNITKEEIAEKKLYWFNVADRMLDEMEKDYYIPIDHFTFHSYIRFLTLVGELELSLASAQDAHDGCVVEVRERTWVLLLNAHLFAGEYNTAEKVILPYVQENPELYQDRIERWTRHQHRERPHNTNYVANTH